jgi:hypothetical protein
LCLGTNPAATKPEREVIGARRGGFENRCAPPEVEVSAYAAVALFLPQGGGAELALRHELAAIFEPGAESALDE